ncbi:uncharacterized protein LOC128271412 [Anopheles cruzii]|uniref:uncharacterized protein LOC128271412 n=1 Tax=Anopheles cruzii TaxID=68878 RepID=UPI0022EC90D6|nr:uncharacterized protein LOC128271412 [Anopheles cruzii]
MVNYAWNGMDNAGCEKKLLKDYDIFTTCMLGNNVMARKVIKKKITYIRKVTKNEDKKIKIAKPDSFGCTEQDELFTFPITTIKEVERLERAVTENKTVRDQYEKRLRSSLDETPSKPSFAILNLFSDEALANFNYSGLCNYTGDKKKAMKNYQIFTTCINNAWASTYSECETIQFVRGAIILIGNRKRMRTLKGKTKLNPARKPGGDVRMMPLHCTREQVHQYMYALFSLFPITITYNLSLAKCCC